MFTVKSFFQFNDKNAIFFSWNIHYHYSLLQWLSTSIVQHTSRAVVEWIFILMLDSAHDILIVMNDDTEFGDTD